MKRHVAFIFVAILLTQPVLAKSIYPHTPLLPTGPVVETGQAFLDAAKTVKADPIGADADILRKPMAEWIEKTDEVMVVLCDEIEPIVKNEPLKAVLLFQYMMESAVHQLQHPDTDARNAQIAGLQSMLALYLDFKKSHPQETYAIPYVDELVGDFQKQGRKGLEKHTCEQSGSAEPPPPEKVES